MQGNEMTIAEAIFHLESLLRSAEVKSLDGDSRKITYLISGDLEALHLAILALKEKNKLTQ